jgi:riboflavin kinase/FMN adenylyltransferase
MAAAPYTWQTRAMATERGLPAESRPSVIAPGNHDGVHLGHQALVRSAVAHARRSSLSAVALTFHPHPAAVLSPDAAPTPLTTIERRSELLRAAGADEVLVQPFTSEFANLSPDEFLTAFRERGVRGFVVGPDFRFGHGRAGDVALLQARGRELGFDVLVEPPVLLDGARVSSSGIRQFIASGEMDRATAWLGHVYDLSGRVISGDRRGRTLGFPTANLETDPVLLPVDGVYAVVARVLDRQPETLLFGVANLGTRPTFAAGPLVEVHLFDFAGDLYGAQLRVGFVRRIRSAQRFPSADALRQQIALDCEAARATLAATKERTWAWI